MRKVFLDDLPRKKRGIDWSKSIGYEIKFVYDNIEGFVTIMNYNIKSHYIWIKYLENSIYRTNTSNLINCQLGDCIGKFTSDFKYKIGEKFIDDRRNIVIIDRYYKNTTYNKKWYRYKCNKCGWENEQNESNLTTGNGCPVCSNKKIIKGINDISTTHPHLIKYFVNIEDAYTNTYGSDSKVWIKCIDCGFKRKIRISDFIKCKYNCHKCGDGISYPEKIMVNILCQLVKNNFIYQLTKSTYKWCEKYKYDFYFELNNKKYIIETHGEQHYTNTFNTIKTSKYIKTLKEQQENDKIKKELALQNGIKEENYIIIDCRESNIPFIKNKILDSSLSKTFNLSNINWDECSEFANSNLVKQVCNYWNNKKEHETTTNLCNIFKLGRPCIIKYLKIGRGKNSGMYAAKKVICLNTMEIFNTISEARINYSSNNITLCCQGKYGYAGKHPETGEPLKWMYYDDYIKKQNEINT